MDDIREMSGESKDILTDNIQKLKELFPEVVTEDRISCDSLAQEGEVFLLSVELIDELTLLQGDSLSVLKGLPSESVHCVVTSPPYWALRDYGVEGQIGRESTFHEYILNLLDIFDEVRRVLRSDGTCWVNLGDTYSGTGHKKNSHDPKYKEGRNGQFVALNSKTSVPSKSLCCIPDRFKFEMVDRGWICRNELIWQKPNAMPSSVKDRFTVDFEKVFFFTKHKKYYFKQLFEPLSEASLKDYYSRKTFRNKGSNNVYACPGEGRDRREFYNPDTGRNKRCVWSINTKPFKGAHFAVFPEDLINPIIDAGCPEGGIVMDPFMGSGTTGMVALKQKKNFIGIDLNSDYIELARERISDNMSRKTFN